MNGIFAHPADRESTATRTRGARWSPLTAVALALAALAIAPPPADAQTPDPAAGDTATADTFALPGVVVTATRVPLDREAVPTPVSVITGAELRASGARTVAEALRQVPSAAVVPAGPAGAQTSLFLRGGESDYVQVLIDGVPVNDPGGAFDYANLSLDQVERIEVVRGPVSVLYGSHAVAGAIQIFTRRGRGAPTLIAEVTGGQGEQRLADDRYGTWDAEATVYGSSGSLAYTVGGGYMRGDGVYPFNNANEQASGSLRLSWIPADGAELAVSSRLSDGRYEFPTDGAGALVDRNAFLDRTLWSTSVEGGLRITDRVDARVQYGLVLRDQTSIDEQDDDTDTSGVFASRLAFDGTRHFADARVNARLPRTVLTAGVAYETADAATSYSSQSSFGPFDADAGFDRSTTGLYGQLLAEPIDRLHLTLGARVDDSDSYETFGTWRAGATAEPVDGTRLRAAAGTSFREPTFAEAFGSGFGDLGDPALEPEQSRSWEVGLEQDIGPATLAATWFDQEFESLIQYTFTPIEDGGPNYYNVGAAEAEGLELEGRAIAGPWSASASYTWLRTEVLDPGLETSASFAEGESLLRRPEHAWSAALRYAFTTGTVAVTVNTVGEREDLDFSAFPAPRVTLPEYTTLDLAASWLVPVTAVDTELLVRLDNVMDAEFEPVYGFPGTGRVIRVGARVRVGG